MQQGGIKGIAGHLINLKKKLGEGKEGDVYLAKNKQTKEKLAVKIIKRTPAHQQRVAKNELKILQEASSQNIMKFRFFAFTEKNLYIFSELADQDLRELLKQKGRLKQPEAIFYIQQILNGFAELIKHGFVHRDIKPSNILLKDNVIKIADFGLSRNISRIEYSKTYCGSPLYASPQILKNQPYNYKCDIWSLGVIFYELVFGVPWHPKHQNEVLTKIQEFFQDYKYPNGVQISFQYKNLIEGCLKLDQKARFDWHHVFNHPLFKGKFKNVCTDFQNIYDLTDLRISVSQKNINVVKLLNKLPSSLNNQQFIYFIRALNPQLNQKSAEKLFNYFSGQRPEISREQIIQIFLKKKIIVEQSEMVDQAQQSQLSNIFKRVSKAVELKQLNPYDLYVKYNKNKSDRLSDSEFNKIFIQILDQVTTQQLKTLFSYFCEEEGKQAISLNLFNQKFCKIMEIPMLDEKQQFSAALKKILSSKKQ